MGMDIMGIKPTITNGKYFSANLWSWRPIHFLCEHLNITRDLKFDTSRWGYNDGDGLRKTKDCLKLAETLESYIINNPHLKDDDDRLYLCLGMWCHSNSNQIVRPKEIDSQYPTGTILYSSVVTKAGDLVQPAHSTTLGHIKEFILFLKTCGGFKIY